MSKNAEYAHLISNKLQSRNNSIVGYPDPALLMVVVQGDIVLCTHYD